MLARLARIDDGVIGVVQAIYLWIWDRTGIHCYYILGCLWACDVGLSDNAFFAKAFWLIGMNVISLPRLLTQQHKKYAAYNALARQARHDIIRFVFVVVCLIGLVQQATDFSFPRSVLGLIWVYLMCAQIRDREPPQKTSTKLAWSAG